MQDGEWDAVACGVPAGALGRRVACMRQHCTLRRRAQANDMRTWFLSLLSCLLLAAVLTVLPCLLLAAALHIATVLLLLRLT